jgi:hypothetical protein
MGNASSNVTSGIKKQAEGAASSTCYKLVDLKGMIWSPVTFVIYCPFHHFFFEIFKWPFYVFRRNNPSAGGGLLI